jgi:hypothetical protein
MPIKYIVVDKKIIPVSTRKSKYQEILDKAKTLKDNEAIAIQEDLETSLISIMSYMRMQNHKVSLRTVNKIKTLYISKAEPKIKKA